MKTLIAGTLILFTLATTSSCKRNVVEGHGNITMESRVVSGFNAIEIKTPIDAVITISSSAAPSCRIKGYSNLLSKIKTEVHGGKLVIFTDKVFHFSTDRDLTAEITIPSITDLTIKGASDVKMHGTIVGDKFTLDIKGAGDVEIDDIRVNNFHTELSGSGDVAIKAGSANYASYRVAGAGDIAAFPLQSKSGLVSIAGVGDVEVSVSDKLEAKVAGAGAVSYKGTPQLTTKITGAGEVEQANSF